MRQFSIKDGFDFSVKGTSNLKMSKFILFILRILFGRYPLDFPNLNH